MGTRKARGCLKNNWGQAILTEGGVLCGQLALTLAEWGMLLGLGLPLGRAAFVYPAADMRPVIARMVIVVVLVILDLLILSPLKLGRSVFYWEMIHSLRSQPGGYGRQYFKGKRYRQALHWRLQLWGRRLGWSLLLWTPSMALLWVGEWMRLDSLRKGVVDLTCVAFLFLGMLAFVTGCVAVEILMLRYHAAAYGIGRGLSVRESFRFSTTVMKGHIERLLRLYARYGAGLLSCVLALPALYVMPLLRTEQAQLVRGFAKKSAPLEKTAVLW